MKKNKESLLSFSVVKKSVQNGTISETVMAPGGRGVLEAATPQDLKFSK